MVIDPLTLLVERIVVGNQNVFRIFGQTWLTAQVFRRFTHQQKVGLKRFQSRPFTCLTPDETTGGEAGRDLPGVVAKPSTSSAKTVGSITAVGWGSGCERKRMGDDGAGDEFDLPTLFNLSAQDHTSQGACKIF